MTAWAVLLGQQPDMGGPDAVRLRALPQCGPSLPLRCVKQVGYGKRVLECSLWARGARVWVVASKGRLREQVTQPAGRVVRGWSTPSGR